MIRRKNKKTVPLEDWNAFVSTSNSDMDYNELVGLFMRIPETYRAVLEMKLLSNDTDCEIAQHLDITETVAYTWPVADSLSTEIEYRDEGGLKYVQAQTGYTDASGVYEDVSYWTIYIENVELGDVENYIAQLKSYGCSYFSFDESEKEPNVEFVWPGYFMWDGGSAKKYR